jgi:hypothetical protein
LLVFPVPVGEVSTSVDAPDFVNVPAPVTLPVNVWVVAEVVFAKLNDPAFVIVPAYDELEPNVPVTLTPPAEIVVAPE